MSKLPHVMELESDEVQLELLELFEEAGDIELRMLLFMARRWVAVGQREYGVLTLGTGRDWQREKLEEQADRAFYDLAASFERRLK